MVSSGCPPNRRNYHVGSNNWLAVLDSRPPVIGAARMVCNSEDDDSLIVWPVDDSEWEVLNEYAPGVCRRSRATERICHSASCGVLDGFCKACTETRFLAIVEGDFV